MDKRGHQGVPLPLRELTQLALLIRLIALAVGLLLLSGSQLTLPAVLGFLAASLVSLFGLMNTSVLELVRRHPMIAMLDAVLLAGIVALNGIDSPLILAALTTALLLGLWLEPLAAALVMVAILSLYVWSAVVDAHADISSFMAWGVTPFMYVTLWLLGLRVRRSLDAEAKAQRVLHDAVTTAAATEERSRMARELHDSLAKSLQGLAMTATALPIQIERQPDKAVESAHAIREMAAAAVRDVRGVMTGLRTKTSQGTLGEAVTQVVLGWATKTGRSPDLSVEGSIDTADESTRYELLMVLEECLDNVHRHAGPCSVSVALRREEHQLVMTVEDTGIGLDDEHLERAQQAGHHGIQGMSERLMRIGGWCSVRAGKRRGTVVECHVPYLDRIER